MTAACVQRTSRVACVIMRLLLFLLLDCDCRLVAPLAAVLIANITTLLLLHILCRSLYRRIGRGGKFCARPAKVGIHYNYRTNFVFR
jgi:hypothetical protein